MADITTPQPGTRKAILHVEQRMNKVFGPDNEALDEIRSRLAAVESATKSLMARLEAALSERLLNPKRRTAERIDRIEEMIPDRIGEVLPALENGLIAVAAKFGCLEEETKRKLNKAMSERHIEPQKPPTKVTVDPRECLFTLEGDREYIDHFFHGLQGEQVKNGDSFDLVCTRAKSPMDGIYKLSFRLGKRQ